jgi:PAS domain S-box-containing protein
MSKGVSGISKMSKNLVILSIFAIAGFIIDIVAYSHISIYLYFNTSSIALVLVTLVLNYFSAISTKKSLAITIYSTVFNIVIARFAIIYFVESIDAYSLRSLLIISLLLPIAGFVLGRRHILYIGVILLLFHLSITLVTGSSFFLKNIYLLTLLLGGYSFGIHYLLTLLEEGVVKEKKLLYELEGKNSDITFLNALSFELADFSAEKEIVPIMLKEIKQHTQAKLAVFSEYNEEQKALVVKCIDADGVLLKAGIRIAGEKILNTSSPVDEDTYKFILTEKVGVRHSLTQVSFGAIPEKIDIAIRGFTGLYFFYGIVHVISGKLYGTTMLAFRKRDKQPSLELLKSYAQLAALSLRRNIAEKALILKENQLRCITDNISDVVFTTDLELNTKYVSPSIERLTGETPDMYLKKRIEKKHPVSSLRKIRNVLKDEMEKEKNPEIPNNRTRIIEVEVFKADGSIIYVSTHLSFIRNENGDPIGIQGITRDITERKRIEVKLKKFSEELIALNNDKDRFMQIIAHDLKNPFNALIGFSELLVSNYKNLEENKVEYILDIINQTAKNTYSLLDELLLWSNAKSGKLNYTPQSNNLLEICNNAIGETQANAQRKEVSVTVDISSELQITGDRFMLKTIIRNLISNAIKFSNARGEVKLSASSNEDYTTIVVSDNGVGMTQENLGKLWKHTKPFTTKGTKNEEGTGLGLLLCKEFIEKHNGAIWAESELGKGSQFFVRIPFQRA